MSGNRRYLTARQAAFCPKSWLQNVGGWMPMVTDSPSFSRMAGSSLSKSGRQELSQPHQVTLCEGQQRGVLDFLPAMHLRASQPPDVARPAEGLLDQPACLGAHDFATTVGRECVDCRTAVALDNLRDVRGDVQLSHLTDKPACVTALVGFQGGTLRSGRIPEHLHRRAALGSAMGMHYLDCDDQVPAVLIHRVRRVRQLCGRGATLPIKFGIGVSRRDVRIFGALLPREVTYFNSVTHPSWSTGTIFRSEAFVRGPCFARRTVDAEMFIAEQTRNSGRSHNGFERLPGNIRSKQPILALTERRVILDLLIDREPHGQPKQQAKLERFSQHPLAADRVERLQQQCSDELLRCDRRLAGLRVQLFELPIHLLQRLGHHRANRAKRMIRRHPRFRRDVTEHPFLLLIRASHWGGSVMPHLISSNFPESPCI